jgi:hypothetical protein
VSNYKPRRLSGRCSTGAQRGAGWVWHAVHGGASWGTAICGATPGRLSGCGFVEPESDEQAITCPKCLRRLARLEQHAADDPHCTCNDCIDRHQAMTEVEP